MKKFLSLVLALVMTMSLVTISAGAKDFTDAADIDYKEAVAVMSALKIVDGTTDGAFNPNGALTRGAAAKIICNLILGPTTAAALSADAAPFADVPANHTFAGYIAYCVQQGILDGYTDGTFRPSNPLSGYAFMKMLLGALGYDKDVEGFNGPNWSVNVAKLAISLGLDDGNDNFNGVATVTREEALLYAFNAMTETMVKYDTTTTVSVNGATVVVGGSKAEPVVDTEKKNGYIATKDNNDEYLQFCEKYFPKLELVDDEDAKADAFGRPAYTWKNGTKKIGTFAKKADFTYRADQKIKDLYKDVDDQEYYLFVDGVEQTNMIDITKANKNDTNKLAAYDNAEALIGNGSLIEVFEDDQTITVVNTYLAKVVADYDEDAETLTLTNTDIDQPWLVADGKETLKLDDHASIVNYKEDDYVAITVAEGVVKSLTKVTPVSATVTEYADTESVTAGGETYKYNVTNTAKDKEYGVKKDFAFYLDDQNNILFAKGVEATAKYVYVAEFYSHTTSDSNRTPLSAFAYLTDGTEVDITVAKINTVKKYGKDAAELNEGNSGKGAWYTYTEKAGKYELSTIVDDTPDKGDEPADLGTGVVVNYDGEGKLGTQIGADTNVRANSATIFVVVDKKDNVKVYTGIKNTPDIDVAVADGIAKAVVNGRYAKVVFIDIGELGSISGGSNSTDLIYFLKQDLAGSTQNGVDADDVKYYRYSAIVNGKETKVKTTTDITLEDADYYSLFAGVEYDAKGYVVDMEYATAEDADLYEAETLVEANVTLKGQVINFVESDVAYSYYLSEDGYTIYMIDRDADDMVKTVSTGTLATKYKSTNTLSGALSIVMNEDGDVTALYIDVTV